MSTYFNQLQPALQNVLRVVWFFHPRSHARRIYRQTKITVKASDVAENLQLYCCLVLPPEIVIHVHDDAYIGGCSEN